MNTNLGGKYQWRKRKSEFFQKYFVGNIFTKKVEEKPQEEDNNAKETE